MVVFSWKRGVNVGALELGQSLSPFWRWRRLSIIFNSAVFRLSSPYIVSRKGECLLWLSLFIFGEQSSLIPNCFTSWNHLRMSEPWWRCFMGLRGAMSWHSCMWWEYLAGMDSHPAPAPVATQQLPGLPLGRLEDRVFWGFNPSCLMISASFSPHDKNAFLSTPFLVTDGEPSITGQLQTCWEQTCPFF